MLCAARPLPTRPTSSCQAAAAALQSPAARHKLPSLALPTNCSVQVGACIVDQRNVICGIGYNGFPRGCSDSQVGRCRLPGGLHCWCDYSLCVPRQRLGCRWSLLVGSIAAVVTIERPAPQATPCSAARLPTSPTRPRTHLPTRWYPPAAVAAAAALGQAVCCGQPSRNQVSLRLPRRNERYPQ